MITSGRILVFEVSIWPMEVYNMMHICKMTLQVLYFPEVKMCDSGVNNIPLYHIEYSLVNILWRLGWLYDWNEVYFLILAKKIM